MKLAELSKDTDLSKVKVIIPEEVVPKFLKNLGNTREMYIAGNALSTCCLSPEPTPSKTRQLFVVPIPPCQIIGWNVVEDDYTREMYDKEIERQDNETIRVLESLKLS